DHFRQNGPTNRYQLAGWLGVPSAANTAPQPSMATSGGGQQQLALPRLGAVEDLGMLLVNNPLHEVIAVQSASDRDWLTHVIEDCDYSRVRLRIVPEALLAGTFRDRKLVFRSEPRAVPWAVRS